MKRCLTIDEEILINQFSQGIHTMNEMDQWFQLHDLDDKRDIMENLFNLVIQSHPDVEDIKSSAVSLGKENSSSAVILLNKNKPFTKFGCKICDLPEKELLNGFNILLLTLSKADNRRKERECRNGCSHWWHKDLSDYNCMQTLLLLCKTNKKYT